MKIYLDNCCSNRPFDDQAQLKIYLWLIPKLPACLPAKLCLANQLEIKSTHLLELNLLVPCGFWHRKAE
jgi:hypothetical protein